MTLHQIIERRKPADLEPAERVRQRICRAIVTIHAEGRYYDGLDLLCELVGWGTFRNELYPEAAMTDWLASKGAKRIKPDLVTEHPAMAAAISRTRVCKTCRRQYVVTSIPKPNLKNRCSECGRGRRKNAD
jgi:hypothetical protein